jgi:signal transduction histidine kinase
MRGYTQEQPLIYEDAWEKWPYAFINDEGKPDGFNVELVSTIMERLNIPYVVRLRNQVRAHEDLRHYIADLSLGVYADYNALFGQFGKVGVCPFENALIQLRKDSIGKTTVKDLHNIEFSVRAESRAYYYLVSHGFADSTLHCVENMEAEVLRIASEKRGAAVWNAMMLKWMVKKYHLTDMSVTLLDIPPGDYRFMSNDPKLLAKIDSVCLVMKNNGEIDRMMNRWLNADNKESTLYEAYIISTVIIVLLIIICAIWGVHIYRKYYSQKSFFDVFIQMGLVLSASDIRVWVYDPVTRRYAWMDYNGSINEDYNSFEFSRFYPENDFNAIHSEVMKILDQESEGIKKVIRCYKNEDDKVVRDVEVAIEGIKDDYGKPYLICGIQRDITESRELSSHIHFIKERTKAAFHISLGSILRFDSNGLLLSVNKRCCMKLGIQDAKEVLDKHYYLSDFGIFKEIDIDSDVNDFRFVTRMETEHIEEYIPFEVSETFNPDIISYPKALTAEERNNILVPSISYYTIHFTKLRDANGAVIGYLLFMSDITDNIHMLRNLQKLRGNLSVVSARSAELKGRRNFAMSESNTWMLRYFPDRKRLLFYDRNENKMKPFSQVRVLEMIDGRDIKRVFKLLQHMDAFENLNVEVNVRMLMRNAEGYQMHFRVYLRPIYNDKGEVESYFGICKDTTRVLIIQQQLRNETQKAREAEHVKQNFLKNMSYSIRQPLTSIRRSINKFVAVEKAKEEQKQLDNIIINAQQLIALSDDTLLLSRAEADMLTPSPEPLDFVELYKKSIDEGLNDNRVESVKYNVIETYNTLQLKIDRMIVSRALREAVALSARYTHSGSISIRYVFAKDQVRIVIEDTSHGIPPSTLEHIFEPLVGVDVYNMSTFNRCLSGLEMPLCKVLLNLIHGDIDIESIPGRGNLIYITFPAEQ